MGADAVIERARWMLEALARTLQRQAALGVKLPRVAVCWSLSGAETPVAHTLLVDGGGELLDGTFAPAGMPVVRLRGEAAGIVDVLSGARRAAEVAAAGELALEGRVDLLAALSACLPATQPWLATRIAAKGEAP
jgi:hypothetical protein